MFSMPFPDQAISTQLHVNGCFLDESKLFRRILVKWSVTAASGCAAGQLASAVRPTPNDERLLCEVVYRWLRSPMVTSALDDTPI
uniref:Uncharacterized protein n=1 Tax=Trichuris muris TaxID=70415 RepID=A0A5S6Q7T8_TRIMR